MAATSKQRRRKRVSRGRFLLSITLFFTFLFALYKSYDLLFSYLQSPHTFPVARVVVQGQLTYINRDEVATVVGKLAGGKNLVTLDISPIHNAMVQMPWVAAVAVVKKFPDTLEINLVEHYPSALWKNTGIYDVQTNSVFYPDLKDLNLPLVTLNAPNDKLAGELYTHAYQFIELTRHSPYYIQEVQLDPARGYRIKIEGDVWLILGRESVPELPLIRLKRFLLSFKQTKLKLSDVAYIDLRYDNGFAIGERNSEDSSQGSNANKTNSKSK